MIYSELLNPFHLSHLYEQNLSLDLGCIENLENYFAHNNIDAKGALVLDQDNNAIEVSNEIVFVEDSGCVIIINII